jgi:hydroxyacylglutathione hydrolase
MIILPIPAFDDNYIWCIHDNINAIVVDPGDHVVVDDFLKKNNLNLSSILITHHHFDHTGGILELKNKYSPVIYGPFSEINGIDTFVSEGDFVTDEFLKIEFEVYEIPGHTLDHIAFKNQNNLFCGDTIFSSGCGRIFEGTYFQMFNSLKKMASFPDDTKIYCAHEYTLNNINFAKSIEPENSDLIQRELDVKKLRAENKPSIPTTLSMEKKINPFLRCAEKNLINKFQDNKLSKDIDIFTHLRKLKDDF